MQGGNKRGRGSRERVKGEGWGQVGGKLSGNCGRRGATRQPQGPVGTMQAQSGLCELPGRHRSHPRSYTPTRESASSEGMEQT